MATPQRSHPHIPDHEILRKIGGGAYGEVWMARAVTGALRAVKVVWREDFSDARTFEREFDGILKFEPVSRHHPALINILHVGRSPDSTSFYYYVMELADDVISGQDINPIEYEAHTLRADGHAGVRLETGLCIDVGIRLAEALEHLHSRDLSHRDVKPSNVIFINRKAKLADIGLVAAHGQRTFVGTEGFVPPEGPGSPEADIYSLGKVLYEIATGKDRLEFPELPDDLPTGIERRRWLDLNRIICDVCEPRINKRKIRTAAGLAAALKTIQKGKRRHNPSLSIWATIAVLLGFATWASWESLKNSTWFPWEQITQNNPKTEEGLIRVVTAPEGAEVFKKDGTLVGITPTSIGTLRAEVGSKVTYTIRKNGYRSLTTSATVTPESVNTPMLIFRELQIFSPPVPGEKWEDHLGLTYLPADDKHLSSRYVSSKTWKKFLTATNRAKTASEYLNVSELGKTNEIVLGHAAEITAFIDWHRTNGIQDGFLTEDNEVSAQIDTSFKNTNMSESSLRNNLKPFRIQVSEYKYGAIQLTTTPPGAEVSINDIGVGSTANKLTISKVKPGPVELLLILEGYKPLTVKSNVKPGEILPLTAVLQKNQGVVFGKPWQNGLGMKFEPVNDNLMASAFETRVRDFEAFLIATSRERPRGPDFDQGPNHPIVHVSREDAIAFCDWLTEKERVEERISPSHQYRLPTDLEWSFMAGLPDEAGDGPIQRDANKPNLYPWGTDWPPPIAYGNYSDTTAGGMPGITPERIISGFDDGFARTAPVGSFEKNNLGLHDLSGNVQEWVADDITEVSYGNLGVLRGGSWNTYLQENLLTGWRNPVPPNASSAFYGFRVVLFRTDPSQDPAPTESPPEPTPDENQ
jgi:eukaryotic-like serine/threonine-protein kinase